MTMTLSRPVPMALPKGIRPNSRTHWALLLLGAAGSVAFNATYVLDGFARTGYDPLRQPMSALSLGPVGCVSAAGWRATLAPGPGATWYPRLRVLAGLAMIAAGVFTQDPGAGYPVGMRDSWGRPGTPPDGPTLSTVDSRRG